MSTVAQPPMYGWDTMPWRKLRRSVWKLQKRIYQARLGGNTKLVRKLQRLLMSSRAAKLLAVRRVTQDNSGKKTAGIDGVHSLSARQRLRMAHHLRIDGSAKPVRRVWRQSGVRREETFGYTGNGGPRSASSGQRGARTRMGSVLRSPQLWFSSGKVLP